MPTQHGPDRREGGREIDEVEVGVVAADQIVLVEHMVIAHARLGSELGVGPSRHLEQPGPSSAPSTTRNPFRSNVARSSGVHKWDRQAASQSACPWDEVCEVPAMPADSATASFVRAGLDPGQEGPGSRGVVEPNSEQMGLEGAEKVVGGVGRVPGSVWGGGGGGGRCDVGDFGAVGSGGWSGCWPVLVDDAAAGGVLQDRLALVDQGGIAVVAGCSLVEAPVGRCWLSCSTNSARSRRSWLQMRVRRPLPTAFRAAAVGPR